VSLKVAAGGITALLGSNGAGKTTLLKAASGLLPVRRGRIRFYGEDITKLAGYRRAQLGFCHIPEGRGVYRSLSVLDNLRMQAAKGEEQMGIERALDAFGVLSGRLEQTAGTLSGGEQQMLAMAAAYVSDPRLIVVDEPSLGLAPVIVDKIFASLEALARRGTALLLVDQYVSRALALADKAYVLRRGEIVYDGDPAALSQGEVFEQYLGPHGVAG
jgi:branched-chain amino acid transport system ATP-binding protein